MQLNSLKLINFRNYDNLYIDFNKKVKSLSWKKWTRENKYSGIYLYAIFWQIF